MVLLLALSVVVYLGNMKFDKILKKATANGQKADAATAAANEAKVSADASAGLLQSIGKALNAQVSAGTLTPSQLTAIAAAIQANQAARTGAAGATPGIPGSRGGGGMSVTPGVVGSGGVRGVAANPGTSRSSTSNCLLTIESGILRLDGTVCPP